jgi:uncharacterized protein YbjT (DUF2867 family)
MRILVTGATGFVGRSLIPALLAEGHDVVAGTRRPRDYGGPGVPVGVDLLDPPTLRRALDGCDAAYYLVHSMETPGDFMAHDRAAAVAFRDAAVEQGLRVIYLGGLGESDATGRSDHLRSRHEVGAILRDGADTVELRAAIVIGAGSVGFEILRQLVERLPVMICPRWVASRCQPIGIDDVVRYLVGVLRVPAGSYEIGGADILTYEQMLRRYAALTGRRRLIVKVPVLSPSLSSHWIGLITDQSAAVARPLADGLSVEVVVRDDRMRRLVPFDPLGYDDAVLAALADEVRTPPSEVWLPEVPPRSDEVRPPPSEVPPPPSEVPSPAAGGGGREPRAGRPAP